MIHANKPMKALVIGTGILFTIVLAQLMVPTSSTNTIMTSYINLTEGTRDSEYKKLKFINTYVDATGDTQLAEELGFDSTQVNSTVTPDNSVPPTDSDWTSVSKVVAAAMEGQYNLVPTKVITIDGRSMSLLHRDCSCLVGGILYFMGYLDSFKTNHMNSRDFVSARSGTTVPAATFADVQIGDVLAKNGHVAVVIKIDTALTKVYTADAGSVNAVNKTTTSGYAQEFDFTDLITKWRVGAIKVKRYAP